MLRIKYKHLFSCLQSNTWLHLTLFSFFQLYGQTLLIRLSDPNISGKPSFWCYSSLTFKYHPQNQVATAPPYHIKFLLLTVLFFLHLIFIFFVFLCLPLTLGVGEVLFFISPDPHVVKNILCHYFHSVTCYLKALCRYFDGTVCKQVPAWNPGPFCVHSPSLSGLVSSWISGVLPQSKD